MSGMTDQEVKVALVKEFELFFYSKDVYYDRIRALARLKSLAEAKSAYAPACLAIYEQREQLFETTAQNRDEQKAEKKKLAQPYLDQAVAAKYPPAQYAKAMELEEVKAGAGQDLLKAAADQGYAPAQFELARALLRKIKRGGQGQKSYNEVIGLFEAAAQAGCLEALRELGDLYSGNGASNNPSLAVKYYLAAARGGDSESIERLAKLAYQYNTDVYYQALKQLADEGYVEACFELGEIYKKAEEAEEEKEAEEAAGTQADDAWSLLRPAVSSPPAAILADKKSGETSNKWYEKAAAQGHQWALHALSPDAEHPARPVPYRVISGDSKAPAADPQPVTTVWDFGSWLSYYEHSWRKRCYNPSFLGLSSRPIIDAWSPIEVFEYAIEDDKDLLLSLASDEKQGDVYIPVFFEIYQRRNELFRFKKNQQGTYLQEDGRKALAQPYLQKAVEANYPPAQYAKAMGLEEEEAGSGQALFKAAADQGYVPAQLKQAQLLLRDLVAEFKFTVEHEHEDEHKQAPDEGTISKIARIISLLEAAKKAGNLSAARELAGIYSGHAFQNAKAGVFNGQVDHKKASNHYLEAARQGDIKSIRNLGRIVLSSAVSSVFEGRDVIVESDGYYKALKQLAQEGYIEACYQLACIYQKVEETSKLDSSSFSFDSLLPMGEAIQKDMSASNETAEQWYKKAAEQGHRQARLALDGLKPDSKAAAVSSVTLTFGDDLPYRVLPSDLKASSVPSQPLVEEWGENDWLRGYDYDWRKQKYDPEFSRVSKSSVEMFPRVHSAVFAASPSDSGVGSDQIEDEDSVRSGRPLAIWLSLTFVLGIGLGILALYFSGALVTLAALGLGTVLPFVLAGALGGFLALTLAAGLQLTFKAKSQDLLNSLFVLAPLSFSGLALLLAVTVFASTGLVPLVIAGLAGAGAGLLLAFLLRWKNPISSGPGLFKRLGSENGGDMGLEGVGSVPLSSRETPVVDGARTPVRKGSQELPSEEGGITTPTPGKGSGSDSEGS